MEDPGAKRTGCAPPRRGYRAATPPATLEPRLRRRATSAATADGMQGIPTGPFKAGRSASCDRHGHADETPQAARLERSASRARSGRDGL